MRRVIRSRAVQPDWSPGMLVAGVILLIVIALELLTWWVLIIIVLIPALINQVLLHIPKREEITIDDEGL